MACRLSERELLARFDQSHVAQCSVGTDGRVAVVNDAWCELYAASRADLEGQRFRDICGAPNHVNALAEAFASGAIDKITMETPAVRCDGQPVHLLVTASTVRAEDGGVLSYAIFAQDVSSGVHAREQLALREARWRALVESSSDLALIVDADGTISYVSASLPRLVGYEVTDVVAESGYDWIHEDDRPTAEEALAAVAAEPGASRTLEIRVRHADGSWHWYAERLTNLLHEPAVRGIVANLSDITEQRLAHEQMQSLALYDSTTGLPNTTLLQDRVDRATDLSHDSDTTVLLVTVHLEGVEAVARGHGSAARSELIRHAAVRLREALDPADTLAKLDDAEFAVLVEQAIPDRDALGVAERLREALTKPLSYDNADIMLTPHFGAAEYPVSPAERLVDDSLLALSKARRLEAGFVMFGPALREQASDRLRLAADLRAALSDDRQLVPWFQPVVQLSDNMILGWEALVRWVHPSRGVLSPVDFLDLAEESGLLTTLSERVLGVACCAAADWPEALGYVAVNVSPEQVVSRTFPAVVRQALSLSGLAPRRLALEVTETGVLRDPEQAASGLQELRDDGVRVSIDDFGTGYSGLAQLTALPLDTLKIDRAFLSGGLTQRASQVVVASSIDLARRLRLRSVAEGVEDGRTASALRRLGCDAGQGFLWSPAVPADQVERTAARILAQSPQASTRTRLLSEDQAQALRAMSEEGLSAHTMAARLNRQGPPTLDGKRWTSARVLECLSALQRGL